MADLSENSSLRFLVRRRTTFTWLVPLGLLVATYFYGQWTAAGFITGFLFLLLGEIVRFWAAGYIRKDNAIATTGPYALVRNPLYFGSLLLAVGYLLISGLSWIAWLVVISLFLLFHLAAILFEETYLKGEFGEPYLTYLKQVPRLLPRLIPVHAPGVGDPGGSFAATQAVYNREHITATVTFITALVFIAMHFLVHTPYGVR